jgi:aminopeptidase N
VALVACFGCVEATAQEPVPIAAGRAAPPGTYGHIDVVHYDLEIGLPAPGGSTIQGLATLLLTPAHAGVVEAVLDLTGLAVDEVTVDGARRDHVYRDGRLAVPLDVRASPADTYRVQVRYHGVPDDGLVFRRNVHGRPAVFADNWPNRARFWFPSVDDPSDKATVAFTVHAPTAWRVVANGAEVGAPTEGPPTGSGAPRRTWRWSMDVAASPYNFVIGAADLEAIPLGTAACGSAPASPRDDGCIEVSAWLFREDTAQAHRSFRRAPEMVDYYAELVGPFAFEKLAHVQSATRFGGMENASAIFYTEEGLASGRDMEGTVAHETAHQWFGDDVTESEWPELWLSEGFATYFGHLFFEHADGVEEFRRRMEESRRDYLSSGVTGQPVIARDELDLFALLNANNYPKGAWVLHMLRGILGDEAFFEGIRTYYRRYGGRTVTTDDFRQVMESVASTDLRWFFDQWLHQPGYPVLNVDWSWDAEAAETTVTVEQVQNAAWPVFRLPLQIAIDGGEEGARRHDVEVVGRVQRFRFPAAVEPAGVSLDPDGWVLKRDGRTRRIGPTGEAAGSR